MSREKADALRRLHAGPSILLFPNAWDVASARIVEQAGFPAVATSSAGVANVLGYPDGERISRAEMLDMVRRIAASVAVPVTADMEAGYGVTGEAAAETARGVIAAGAVGMNLEDAKPEGALLPMEVPGPTRFPRRASRRRSAARMPTSRRERTARSCRSSQIGRRSPGWRGKFAGL